MLPLIRLIFCSTDLKLRRVLAPALGEEFRVAIEPRGQRVKELVSKGEADVVILDLDPAYSVLEEQIELCKEIANAPIEILVMAGDDERSTAMELVQFGAFGYVRKPPALRELKAMVKRAQESAALKRGEKTGPELAQTHVCGDLIGSSSQMQSVYNLVCRVADLDAPVLIQGETGTGKELVARAIHSIGYRANRPFVAVPCGAIPEDLIEAELFGHEKGAFTNAHGLREGYFEKAGTGTLFLDEIGELSLNTQAKLLRALQQREFSRLGSSSLIPLQARVLFATHRNLREMVSTGAFRQDLFYRINVMDIHLPSLHDHPEDIPQLAQHFLRRYSKTYHKQVAVIDTAALRSLETYNWPGNIRELENVIQRAIIMAAGNCIRLTDLPEAFQDFEVLEFLGDQFAESFEGKVREYRIKLANDAIQECNGNKTLAAQRLSISRAYLHRLIRGSPVVEEIRSA